MKITLDKPVVRPDITDAEVLSATMVLDKDLKPLELRIDIIIGDTQSLMIIGADEIGQYLNVSKANVVENNLASKIDDKGNLI